MGHRRPAMFRHHLVLLLALCGLAPSSLCLAQATVPAPGIVVLDLSFQRYEGGDHLFSTDIIDGQSTRGYTAEGNRWYLGDTRANTYYGALDVGLKGNLGLSLGAAVVQSGYFGYAPVVPEVDDGEYHTTLQDGSVSLRRPFAFSGILLTPSLGAGFPLTDYPHEGHSAPGRGLVEARAGLHLLKGLGPYASLGFLAIDGGYGYVTNVSDPQMSRLTVVTKLGYYRSRHLTVYGSGSLLETFGGLEWISSDPNAPSAHGTATGPALHTQVSAAREVAVGGGVEWIINSSVGAHFAAGTTVWGENVEDAFTYNAGVSWAFRLFGKSTPRSTP